MTPNSPVQNVSQPLAAVERWALFAVGLYFGLRVIVRTLISNTPEIDEGEILLQSQVWQLGYGSQPPLYTWLQILCFSVFGKTVFALALFKNVLLAGVCGVSWWTGRELAGPLAGVAALCALFFVPQFVWFSQNDLTHSVLAQVFTALLMLVVLRLLRCPSSAGYFALGVIIAGGVYSKYSFGALLGVMVGALATLPAGRTLLRDRRIGWTVVLALVPLAPHLNWVWNHRDWAFSEVDHLRVAGQKPLWAQWAEGLLALLLVLVAYLGPLFTASWIAVGRVPRPADSASLGSSGQLLFRIFVGSLVAAFVAILIFHATFNERWVQQNFYVLPLLLALWLHPLLDESRLRRLGLAAGAVAALVFLVLAGRVLAASVTRAPQRQNLPLSELAEQLKAKGPAPAVILAEDYNPLGGALAMAFPKTLILESGQMLPDALPAGARWLVWREGAKAPALAGIRGVAAQMGLTNLDFSRAEILRSPMKYDPSRSYPLAFLRVP